MSFLDPTRADVEALIRLLCKPDTSVNHAWSRVDFPSDKAIRQCEKESSFRQYVDEFKSVLRNPISGAMGLFQVLPSTAKEIGVPDLSDWRDAVWAGIKYDKMLWVQFKGRLDRVFAAYNWGPGNVAGAITRNGDPGWKNHVPTETVNYCKYILSEPPKPEGSPEQPLGTVLDVPKQEVLGGQKG